MSVTLPTPESNSGKAEWSDVYANDNALKEAVEEVSNHTSAFTWYTPKIIATEESRTNTSFGTMPTPDEITGIVVPENGLLLIGYFANVKGSVGSSNASVALFLGPNQVKISGGTPAVQEVTVPKEFTTVISSSRGLAVIPGSSPVAVTTGQILGGRVEAATENVDGGLCTVFAAAGTYDVSVRFKASLGVITAKERKLWCCVLG